MPSPKPRVVGILAGGGSLPREVAECVVAGGDKVHIVALTGEADADLSAFPTTWVGWGEIGAMVHALRSAGCHKLVIVGSVRRPDLFSLRPDLGFFRNLPAILRTIAAGGDDSVLSRVVRFFEGQGFKVVALSTVAPALLVTEAPLARRESGLEEKVAVTLGFDVVRALGPYDVGQAVVVSGTRIEAIEGAEGTDGMLLRVARQRRSLGTFAAGQRGILVKRPKPGQELRVDLPAIGPDSVTRAAEAGLAGIAVLAGGTLVAERGELVRRADAAGLFVQGVRDRGEGRQLRGAADDWRIETLGGRAPRPPQRADATKGAGLLAALAPFCSSRGAVVDQGHVLAVESGEGTVALLVRASGLRQWGKRFWQRRSGVVVLSQESDAEGTLSTAAAAGLAGVAVVGQPSAALGRAAQDAERLGLFLAAFVPWRGKHEPER